MQLIIKLMSARQIIMTELSWGNRPPVLHFDGCAEIAAIRRLYIGLRVCYKYYKNIVVLVWPGAAHVPITV